MSAKAKTNALRKLEELGIAYETREYQVDPDDLSAESVAAKVGLPAAQVYKTLVVRCGAAGIALAVIPGSSELNLKALARLLGDRHCDLVPLKDVQQLTGYVRGGVTAIAGKKEYPVFLDETAILYDRISVSAGTRGIQMLLTPDDYIRVTQATLGDLSKPKT